MKIVTNKEQMKKTSAILFAIFAVVAISALAIVTSLDDASAVLIKHASVHHNGHSAHGTCVKVHGKVRCHGRVH